tara:strand:+ start:262 stop:606 length:345 start_codon:yes stop_codon:yes gene_type:complete
VSDSSQDTWSFICPEGNEYAIGDTIPMHRAAEGLIFNERVVRVPCPGFVGLSIKDSVTGAVIELAPIQPDEGCFFVGPESQAWRWEYARMEIMRTRAFKIHENAMLQNALEDLE